MIGPAGSGRTAQLAVAQRACWTEGRAVNGCALSAPAAKSLSTSSGIPSGSVAAMLAEIECDRVHVPPGTVLIVDEATMVGTRNRVPLLEQAPPGGCPWFWSGPRPAPRHRRRRTVQPPRADTTVPWLTSNQRQSATWEARNSDAAGGWTGTGSPPAADEDAAWRCWSWRGVHACGCESPADCLLLIGHRTPSAGHTVPGLDRAGGVRSGADPGR